MDLRPATVRSSSRSESSPRRYPPCPAPTASSRRRSLPPGAPPATIWRLQVGPAATRHDRLESEMRGLEQRQRGVLPPRDQPWQPEHEKATEILAPRIAARVGKTGDRSRAELDQTTQD